ncbi:cell wall-binding repeat-containing protein [Buchananella felis]|uniref:cell wall-binding repeat-containing protein n=1 Tax=Buchananella felis TaxID=3231492 RepID=UPI003527F9E2
MQAAIRHAKTLTGPVTIYFPKGTYDLYPDQAEVRELYPSNTVGERPQYKDKRIAILLENMQDVTVDGGGSLLRLHGQQTTFAALRSQRVTFKNFSTDHVAPRVLDLTFTGAGTLDDGRLTREVRIPEGYQYSISGRNLTIHSDNSPYTNRPYWSYDPLRLPSNPGNTSLNDMYEQLLDLDTGHAFRASWMLPVEPLFTGVQSIREKAPGLLEFTYRAGSAPGGVGRSFHVRTWWRDTPGAFVWESKDIKLEDLNVGHLHGFGILFQFNENVTVRNVDFRPPPQSYRTTVGFADLIQVSGDKGEVLIDNCRFGFAHDDPINVHGTYVQMKNRHSNRQATFRYMHHETAGFPQFYEGNEVALVDRNTMRDLLDSDGQPWRGRVVSVDGPTGVDSSHDLRTMKVTFDRDMPAGARVDAVVAENVTYNPKVTISNSHFESIPTRGILMTTRRPVLIENNVFDQMEMASIYVSGDANQWYESAMVSDFTIRGNTFLRPARDTYNNPAPVIFFEPTSGGQNPQLAAHSNVLIEDNTFLVNDRTILDAKSINGLTFRNNRVMRYEESSAPTLELASNRVGVGALTTARVAAPAGGVSRPAFVLRGSNNVVLEGNTYGEGIIRGVQLHHMTGANVDIRDEGVSVGGRNSTANQVFYFSSAPQIAAVNQQGQILGKQEGEAQIHAVVVTPFGQATTAPVKVTVGQTEPTYELIPFEVIRPNPAHARIEGKGLRLVPSGLGSLWLDDNRAGNIHLLPGKQLGVGESVVVKMTGRTQDWYEEAGLILYENDDNYVTIQRKHNNGSPSITVVTEQNGRAEEDSRKVTDPTQQELWLKLTRQEDGIQGAYSLDGVEFSNLGTPVVNSSVGASARIGLMASLRRNSAADNHPFVFTDLNVAGTPVELVREVGSGEPGAGFDVVPTLPEGKLSRLADLAGAQFSLPMPSDGANLAAKDGFVVKADPAVTSYTAKLTPVAEGATMVATVNGKKVMPDESGSYTVQVGRGINVFEVYVTAPNQLQQRIYRWVVLSDQAAAPGPMPDPTPSVTPAPSVTPDPTSAPTPPPSTAPSVTPSASVTPAPSVTPDPTSAPTPPPSTAPSVTPSASVTPAPSVTPVPSASATPAPTAAPIAELPGGKVARIAGSDRVLTSVEAMRQSTAVTKTMVLVDGRNFADAVAAGPLAAAHGAALVLTTAPQLEPAIVEAARQKGVETVLIVGAENSVPASKAAALTGAGFTVKRIAGQSRYETAVQIAGEVAQKNGAPARIYVASGLHYADALAAGAVAGRTGGVVLLSAGSSLPAQVRVMLKRAPGVEVVAVGGQAEAALRTAGLAAQGKTRTVVGKDRYETAAMLARSFVADAKLVVLASGESFPDALSGAALAANHDGVLLLTRAGALPPATVAELDAREKVAQLRVMGGAKSVSQKVLEAAALRLN